VKFNKLMSYLIVNLDSKTQFSKEPSEFESREVLNDIDTHIANGQL